MFSSSLAKTFPFASHAMQVAGCEGRANIIGPIMSVGASAVTQLSSSTVSITSGAELTGTSAEERSNFVASGSGALRLRDFFSPLKDRGLTMFYALNVDYVGKKIVISLKLS